MPQRRSALLFGGLDPRDVIGDVGLHRIKVAMPGFSTVRLLFFPVI